MGLWGKKIIEQLSRTRFFTGFENSTTLFFPATQRSTKKMSRKFRSRVSSPSASHLYNVRQLFTYFRNSKRGTQRTRLTFEWKFSKTLETQSGDADEPVGGLEPEALLLHCAWEIEKIIFAYLVHWCWWLTSFCHSLEYL